MKIIKRNGAEVPFDITKIITAVTKASDSVGGKARLSREQITDIAAAVTDQCQALNRAISVEETYYRDGKWGEVEVCSDEYIKMHMAATCLHYGQEAFEGLKAYRCPDVYKRQAQWGCHCGNTCRASGLSFQKAHSQRPNKGIETRSRISPCRRT